MPDSLSRTFAQFVAPMSYESLPPSVVDKMKASILHAMVTGIIGADTSHGKAAIHLAKTEEGKSDGATMLGDGGKATRSGAAFANSSRYSSWPATPCGSSPLATANRAMVASSSPSSCTISSALI